MAKFIPVEPEKWAEMVKALAEVERLKAENERLIKAGDAIIQNLDPDEGDWSHEDAQAEWSYAKRGNKR